MISYKKNSNQKFIKTFAITLGGSNNVSTVEVPKNRIWILKAISSSYQGTRLAINGVDGISAYQYTTPLDISISSGTILSNTTSNSLFLTFEEYEVEYE